MWRVKLVPKNQMGLVHRRNIFSLSEEDYAEADRKFLRCGNDLKVNVCDLIQAKMNRGYSLGKILARPDNVIEFENVHSDGNMVYFEHCPADWLPAERLKPLVLDEPQGEYGHLETLADRCGYCVELVKT